MPECGYYKVSEDDIGVKWGTVYCFCRKYPKEQSVKIRPF